MTTCRSVGIRVIGNGGGKERCPRYSAFVAGSRIHVHQVHSSGLASFARVPNDCRGASRDSAEGNPHCRLGAFDTAGEQIRRAAKCPGRSRHLFRTGRDAGVNPVVANQRSHRIRPQPLKLVKVNAHSIEPEVGCYPAGLPWLRAAICGRSNLRTRSSDLPCFLTW